MTQQRPPLNPPPEASDEVSDPDAKTLRLRDHIADLLRTVEGSADLRPGVRETPKRVVRFFRSFVEQDEELSLTTFPAEGYDQLIVQRSIDVYSLCEHHLLPIVGHATVGYLPDEKIVGLSKLSRVVRHYAHQLQNQERLTQQIGQLLSTELSAQGVGVIVQARHLCMEMRGVEAPNTPTTTSCLIGAFREDDGLRDELLSLHRDADT